MLTADQQRVKDLLRETITLLCKNGLHFQSEFQIDGLIGITLDREDVFLVTLKETVHSGDVFIRDSKRKHPDERNRCYEDKRRMEHRKNNVSVKSEMIKDDFRKLDHIDRQRKSSMQSRSEALITSKNIMSNVEGNAMKSGDDLLQQQDKDFTDENVPNDLATMDDGNNSGNEDVEQIKTKCFSDVTQEIGLLLDSEMDEKKGFQRSLSGDNDDIGEDSDYRRNDEDEDEAYRSRRDDDDDDGGGGSMKTDFIRKTNSHKFLSPSMSSAANNMEDNDEEPLVVKVEPPDTSYNPYSGGSQRSEVDFDGDGWGSGGHQNRGHPNSSQPGGSRHYQNVNEVFNNNSSSTAFRNAGKPFIQNTNKGQQMATSIFNDNVQLHQQMLNSRQQPQQQRGSNNYNELFNSLVDITQNQGFPGDEFLSGGGDFLHVPSQQFPPHQQMNRMLQRRQRSTFTRTQVKCLEDVFKSVHYVDASLRMKLSRQLNLSEGTINIWFQNRRQKLKKQQQQMMISNPSGMGNDESLLGGGDMNPGGPGPMGGDFIVNQSPGRPSNSSFSGSNAGSSPAYMQSPIHNNPAPSAHNVQFNPMDQCPNFSFNSEPGKT